MKTKNMAFGCSIIVVTKACVGLDHELTFPECRRDSSNLNSEHVQNRRSFLTDFSIEFFVEIHEAKCFFLASAYPSD